VREPNLDTDTLVRRGSAIGRYVVLSWLGRGAMGEVYGAYDPDLDRRLAIKLLRVRRGTSVGSVDGKTRLLREAQAIAKLSHPNVVVVHDVGTYEDRVFIAMEFIEGGTLTFWLHAKPRTWREIIKVFIAAGRGLQHAHEANLVHRDFKPDNVMVRIDGDVRVMDFGLVRYTDLREPEPQSQSPSLLERPPVASRPVHSSVALDETMDLARPAIADLPPALQSDPHTKLTQTGAMLGTPAYMAPEQFLGQTADARTDQFSFCIALYEALYGTRPFDGVTMPELTGNVLAGRVKPPPPRTQVPAAILRVLRRGLSLAPADRYPSMNGLLADLERQSRPRANLLIGAVAGLLLLTAVIGGLTFGRVNRQSLCVVPTERFTGVWESSGSSGSRRAAIETAFRNNGQENRKTTSTGRSSSWGWANARSRTSFTNLSQMMDKYVADWSASYKDACDATNYRRDQSAQVLDLRMSCLTDRLDELRALSNILVRPTAQIIENASTSVLSLGPIDRCSSTEVLRSPAAASSSR
jgi:serine/threonine protein kinase